MIETLSVTYEVTQTEHKQHTTSMNQTKKNLEARLAHKKEQLAHQQERQLILESSIHNTQDDIEQLEYVLHKLDEMDKCHHKRRTITNDNVSFFFIHVSELFDYLQHRLHRRLDYKLTCTLLYARYRFRSRMRAPSRRFLRPATVLSYFKMEREMIR